MRIQFEIRESLADIVAEILYSDKWLTIVREEGNDLKRITVKDPDYESEISVDIWGHEVHITTALSNYVYRIYSYGEAVWCEYIGAFQGLLEQELLPKITPKENLWDSDISDDSLISKAKEALRSCGMKAKDDWQYRQEKLTKSNKSSLKKFKEHVMATYDEFIKIGVPLPPPNRK